MPGALCIPHRTEVPEDIQHALGRIEAKLDSLLGLEDRVRKLEQWHWRMTGAVSILGILVGYFIK